MRIADTGSPATTPSVPPSWALSSVCPFTSDQAHAPHFRPQFPNVLDRNFNAKIFGRWVDALPAIQLAAPSRINRVLTIHCHPSMTNPHRALQRQALYIPQTRIICRGATSVAIALVHCSVPRQAFRNRRRNVSLAETFDGTYLLRTAVKCRQKAAFRGGKHVHFGGGEKFGWFAGSRTHGSGLHLETRFC